MFNSNLLHFDVFSPVFQSVLKVLESPNSWEAFKRASGFTGLLSLVIDMEGALSNPPQGEVWQSLGYQPLLDLLLLSLHILTLAVHLHKGNAHHFEIGGFYERLGEALLQLGCFYTEGPEKERFGGEEDSCLKTSESNQSPGKSFYQFVELAEAPGTPSSSASTPQLNLPVTLQTCIRLLSCLDQFATGTYTPLELSVGPEPEDGCDKDKEKTKRPAGPEGVFSGSPDDNLGLGPQSVGYTEGRSRNTAHSISSVCTEPQYRWIFVNFAFLKDEFPFHSYLDFSGEFHLYVVSKISTDTHPFFPPWFTVGSPAIILFFIQEQSGLL